MQLRNARLCLDCEEVHDAQTCPVCASEVFAYLTRWVPVPDGRLRPRRTTSPEADAVRELTTGSSGRWMKRGALGLTVLGLAGWALNRQQKKPSDKVQEEAPGSADASTSATAESGSGSERAYPRAADPRLASPRAAD